MASKATVCDHPCSLHAQGGKILVHGIEGLNRSAAVVVAFLMTASYCVLEDAYFYLKVLKPHLQVGNHIGHLGLCVLKSIFISTTVEFGRLTKRAWNVCSIGKRLFLAKMCQGCTATRKNSG